jgi:two-component system chemotaxis response regulator CheY
MIKVLIVDDSEAARLGLEELYSKLGCTVVGFAADGVKALDEIEKTRPDLISLDVIMPVMDGIECFRKIRAKYPDQKILIVSLLSNEPRFRDAYKNEIPAELFVSKPTDQAELQLKLNSLFPSM